ncbi:DUF2917 domain-containing protein [uncultured Aquincola sp.]|uniref:DUF2917 domain-containing protein n=1 Tax=uncultured Aquincola sp. TaxID=886556 RepID=UPI0032B199AB
MAHALMSFPQATSAAAWSVALPAGAARTIAAAGHARWIAVTEGQLWLTLTDSPEATAGDVWLQPGEGFALGAGISAVVEGRGPASFQLLEAPQPRQVPGRSAWQRTAGTLESLRRSVQWGAPAAACAG